MTSLHRRRFLYRCTLGSAALFTAPGAFAEALTQTPRQTEGPFYPDKLPLDTDNDLLVLNDNITPAVGEITHLSGTVNDVKGNPVRNATVEIWQVDKNGIYIHTADAKRGGRDENFQGYGRFLTDAEGRYYFRTIKPVAYGPRTPHIHVAVSKGGKRVLTTQLYIKGEGKNDRDRIFLNTGADLRDLLVADFAPVKGSKTGELAARFRIVIGETPEDPTEDRGGTRPPRRRT